MVKTGNLAEKININSISLFEVILWYFGGIKSNVRVKNSNYAAIKIFKASHGLVEPTDSKFRNCIGQIIFRFIKFRE